MLRQGLRIYQKVIIVFLALLGAVYLISLRINFMESDFIHNEISNSVMLNVKYYSKNLNTQFEYIKNQQLHFVNSSNLHKLSYLSSILDSYESVSTIEGVKERLGEMRSSSSYLKNAGVCIKSINKTISFENGISPIPNAESRLVYENLLTSKSETFFYYFDNRMFLLELFPAVAKSDIKKATIVSFLEFDKKSIEESIKQLVITKNSGAVLVDKDFNIVIDSMKSTGIIRQLDKKSILEKAEAGSVGELMTAINGKRYWVTYSKLSLSDLILISYIPSNEITGPLNESRIWFIILSVVLLVVIFIFAFSVNLMIHRPMIKFIKAFEELESDNLDVAIQHNGNDEFSYLYKSFNSMARKLKLSIEQNYEQKIALNRSELKQLQSQINPHFLYNSFFNIYRMCKCGDFENVAYLTQKLGSYYQFITRSGADEVPLYMEFRHAMDYIEIQSIRFSNRVKVNVPELSDELKNLMVPRIILQPIIENSFKHAFEDNINGGTIWIDLGYENFTLYITIEDDGNSMSDEKLEELGSKLENSLGAHEKTGIINVCSRIKLKYGDKGKMSVERSKYGGLKVYIQINYEGGDSNVQTSDCR